MIFKGKSIQVGISPLGWTNDDMPYLGGEISFEQSIKEMSLAGFEGTEVGIKFPKDPFKLKQELKKYKLEIASQWFSTFLCEKPYKENETAFINQLNFLESVGAKLINVCELTGNLFASKLSMFDNNKPFATEHQWEILCDGLNKLGAIAKNRGFKLCYHHHMATVVQTLDETQRLINNTDSDKVYICFDTGHFALAGEDVVKAVNILKSRIGHVHLKDIRKEQMKQSIKEGYSFRKAVLRGCFTVPGDGFINFSSVLKELSQCGYEGWLLVEAEQDPELANSLEYAKKARNYLKSILGF